jgi:hypothetical protein
MERTTSHEVCGGRSRREGPPGVEPGLPTRTLRECRSARAPSHRSPFSRTSTGRRVAHRWVRAPAEPSPARRPNPCLPAASAAPRPALASVPAGSVRLSERPGGRPAGRDGRVWLAQAAGPAISRPGRLRAARPLCRAVNRREEPRGRPGPHFHGSQPLCPRPPATLFVAVNSPLATGCTVVVSARRGLCGVEPHAPCGTAGSPRARTATSFGGRLAGAPVVHRASSRLTGPVVAP